VKQSDVMVGGVYETLVSGALVRVKVLYRIDIGNLVKRSRFRVARADNGQALSKPRTAAALRPVRTAEESLRDKLQELEYRQDQKRG